MTGDAGKAPLSETRSAERIAAPISSVSIGAIDAAAESFVHHVTHLSAAELRDPSALPGWSRAHLVAHVLLNAEGFVEVGTALRRGRPAYMYPAGVSARDAEIDALAEQPGHVLFGRLNDANSRFRQSWEPRPPAGECATAEGHPRFDSSTVLLRRLRELHVHGADLAIETLTVDSWSDEFVDVDLALQWPTVSFRTDEPVLVADETGLVWSVGEEPHVSDRMMVGRRQLLAWVLDRAEIAGLPTLEPWSNRSRWEYIQPDSGQAGQRSR